jgi:basic amino acid/polyamine antiporter, APA family
LLHLRMRRQQDMTEKVTDTPDVIEKSTGTESEKLKGTFDGMKFLVEYVVGAGIFTTLAGIHAQIGRFWVTVAVWIACGLYCLTGALCYAELACMLPGSGGEHVYMKEGYGRVGMYIYDWMAFFVLRPSSIAFFAMKFAIFFKQIISASTIPYALVATVAGDAAEDTQATVLSGFSTLEAIGYSCAFIALITFISAVAPNVSEKVGSALTYVKVLGLFLVVIFGFVFAFWQKSILVNNYKTVLTQDLNPGQAIIDAILTFDGWNAINTIAGDFKNPEKVIPNAITGGICFIIGIYLLVVLAHFFIVQDFSKTSSVFSSISEVIFDTNKWRKLGTYLGNPIICAAVFSSTQAQIASSLETFEAAIHDESLPKFISDKEEPSKNFSLILLWQAAISMVYVVFSAIVHRFLEGEAIKGYNLASSLSVLPYCVFYMLSVLIIIIQKFKKSDRLESSSYKAFFLLPYLFVIATALLIVAIVYFGVVAMLVPSKDEVYKYKNWASIIPSTIVVILFVIVSVIAIVYNAMHSSSPSKSGKVEMKEADVLSTNEISEENKLETTNKNDISQFVVKRTLFH